MRPPTVLVTGSEGAIGRHVVARLNNERYSVVTLDRAAPHDSAEDRLSHVVCDLRDVDELRTVFAAIRPNVVVNMAACLYGSSESDLKLATDINTVAANDVAQLSVEYDADLLVQFSSKAVYAVTDPYASPSFQAVPEDAPLFPESNYGISKLASEFAVRRTLKGTSTVGAILRMGSTYGPGKGREHGAVGWLSTLVAAGATGKTTTVFAEEGSSSDFIYNVDVAHAVSSICRSYSSWDETMTMNIATGALSTVDDICSVLNSVAGRTVAVQTSDQSEAEICVPPVGLVLDVSKASECAGFVRQFDLASGLGHFYSHMTNGVS
jgi:nucleoside-diphosphate-sugar epimerase